MLTNCFTIPFVYLSGCYIFSVVLNAPLIFKEWYTKVYNDGSNSIPVTLLFINNNKISLVHGRQTIDICANIFIFARVLPEEQLLLA